MPPCHLYPEPLTLPSCSISPLPFVPPIPSCHCNFCIARFPAIPSCRSVDTGQPALYAAAAIIS